MAKEVLNQSHLTEVFKATPHLLRFPRESFGLTMIKKRMSCISVLTGRKDLLIVKCLIEEHCYGIEEIS